MYLMFKIKIFKMQLLKNYTANPVNSTCSLSICSPSFSENCPTRGVFSKKINVKKNLMLIGRRVTGLTGCRQSHVRDPKVGWGSDLDPGEEYPFHLQPRVQQCARDKKSKKTNLRLGRKSPNLTTLHHYTHKSKRKCFMNI